MTITPSKIPLVTALAMSCMLLNACSDSDNVLASGGGAGDGSGIDTDANKALILLYTGVYNLQDAWNGTLGDRAFLVIREPGDDATAESLLIDYDETNSCIPSQQYSGTVYREGFNGQVFMDGILQLDSAVLTLTNTTLSIEYEDHTDLDNDGDTSDTFIIQGDKLDITELDLGDACT